MKRLIKNYFPSLAFLLLIPVYVRDWYRYANFSGAVNLKGKYKLSGKITAQYHVVEKGLTMPETRLGFGRENLLSLIANCNEYIAKYGIEDDQVYHAVAVVLEYKDFHEAQQFKLDDYVLRAVNLLHENMKSCQVSAQIGMSEEKYFSKVNMPFPEFSTSRSSIRNYSNLEVPIELIEKAVALARNTPSACNRQTVRIHVFSDKKLINEFLKVQGGNRGFGHLANKLIVITAELGVFHGLYERNQAYVDGGMWAMNLLYALHYYKIAACSLNCSNSPEKDEAYWALGNIPKSETFVMMISCGFVPENFKVATSARYPLQVIAKIQKPQNQALQTVTA